MGLTALAQVVITGTLLVAVFAQNVAGLTHYLFWNVEDTNYTRNCATVNITTVNGMFPGPTVEIWEGDTVVAQVTNLGRYDVTIHWHGIKQFLTNWVDGPSGITQCPLKYGQSYTYEFTVTGQSGTFWWHAHIDWLRATVHGPFIVHPRKPSYSLKYPPQEITLLLGTWYSEDPNVVQRGGLDTDSPVEHASVVFTINGKTGPLNGCNGTGSTEIIQLIYGRTYRLRVINVDLNYILFFKIANHNMTVVAADGNPLKPFTTDTVILTPGQTLDVLLVANQTIGKYYFGASAAAYAGVGQPPPLAPALGIFEYLFSHGDPQVLSFPSDLQSLDLGPENAYYSKLKNLNPYSLPNKLDKDLYYVVGVAETLCFPDENCTKKLVGSINNITFEEPRKTSLLQAYYYNIPGVFTRDFPEQPPVIENFSAGPNPDYAIAKRGTRVQPLNFGDTVQLVLQDLLVKGGNSHPFHLHGHNFYVVGRNYGNYDPQKDPATFNLVDPPQFNTISFPQGGWVAIRFQANNPGVWLLHCHFEVHIGWGMETVFVTSNGVGSNETLLAPKRPPPSCY